MGARRLSDARSPYLRQHADNPVDWHPWGDEAFRLATEAAKPVLLSVGYAACHWCHVMAHESFEAEDTAALLNDAFVCVKVDREERPDVDALYMQAVHALAGRGGWPMTVLLTPEGDPFWGGTYLPKGALEDLARKVRATWASDEARLRNHASMVKQRIAEASAGWDAAPPFEGSDAELLDALDRVLERSFDPRRGGYGGRPKFPPHAELLHLLDRWGEGEAAPRRQLRLTLDAMADGGIHDHLGGGFHRYSTDADWLLPHFEKMLYDNALLAQAYAGMYAATREARYRDVAQSILAWVRREMAREGGGYASSLDADTEGEEGLTYTWTEDQIRSVLPKEQADLVIEAFGVRAAGNFRDEATRRLTGRNVLHRLDRDDVALEGRLEAARSILRGARDQRPQPGRDGKAIVAWNGLLLAAFARVGRDVGDAEALRDGRRLAAFLLEACRRDDGALLRFPRGDGPELCGFAEDHVHVIDGLLDLGDATGEARWSDEAAALADDLLRHFEDDVQGGFFTTSGDRHEALFLRRKEAFDNPIPSDNAVAARVLIRLGERDPRYLGAADRTLAAWRPLMGHEGAARGMAGLFRALRLRGRVEAG